MSGPSAEKEIEQILGRSIEFQEITHDGKKGLIPIYFNYSLKDVVSRFFSESREESAQKLLSFLQNQGDTDAQARD